LELDILRLPGLGRILRGMERWALRSASTLLTISPLMLEKLRSVVGEDRRTCYVPNWIHRSLRTEIERQAQRPSPRRPLSLFYSGNLGVKQGLPSFLAQYRAAGAGAGNWSLTIHGGGAERERLLGEVARTPGCALGPVLDEESYVANLRSCTACLVTQSPGVGSNFLPSKLLPALATGTPVLAVCEPGSPLGQEVSLGGYGKVVSPGNSAMLASLLSRWASEPTLLESMRARALQRAPEFDRERVLSVYEQELLSLAAARPVVSTSASGVKAQAQAASKRNGASNRWPEKEPSLPPEGILSPDHQ
jgi:colanic acid biosynthesis glycosyl transferase WcaI